LRCRAGTANYPYCSAVDASDADYVLHLDSDMLLHAPDGGGWVQEAVATLAEHPDAIAVQPMGGPPIANNLAELVFGRRARPVRDGRGANPGGMVSTRVFVVERSRLYDTFLPLLPNDPGDRWEEAFSTTAQRRGMYRY